MVRVHLVDAGPPGIEAETGAAALAALAAASGPPAALLVAAGARGAGLAPRAAIGLGAACLDDCLGVRAGADGLRVTRWACDDRLHEEWLVTGRPLVATLRPQTRAASPRRRRGPNRSWSGTRAGARAAGPPPRRAARRAGHRAPRRGRPHRRRRPGDRRPRVARGRSRELAGLLGASLGASRPLADRGWVPFERQIGTTGQMVAPRLYIALGISGALQHLSGIIGAETMVAVNTDRTCPMMARATLAVAGDVAEVLPLLLARLAERAGAVAAP